jgi:hypothetical protein
VRVTQRGQGRLEYGMPLRILATKRTNVAIVMVETASNRYVSLVDPRGAGWFATYRLP